MRYRMQSFLLKVKTIARNRDWLRAENDVNLAKTQRTVPVALSRGAAQFGLNLVGPSKSGTGTKPQRKPCRQMESQPSLALEPVPFFDSLFTLSFLLAMVVLSPLVNADERSDYLDRYQEHLAELEVGDEQRSEIKQLFESDADEPTDDVLLSVVSLQNKDFASALENYEDGQLDRAVQELEALAKSEDEFVAAESKFLLSQCLVEQNDHETALSHLEEVSPLHAADAVFLRGICQANMLQREKAIESFAQFMRDFPDASERKRIAAWRQLEILSLIQEGSLVDVYQKMEYARRRLALARGNEPTQTRQKETIDILDKLIEEAEEREAISESEEQKPSKKKAGSKAGKGAGKQGPGEGVDDKTPMKTVRQVQQGAEATPWDHLRDKKRDAKALAAIKEKYPARYRALIEQYYRSLQEEAAE